MVKIILFIFLNLIAIFFIFPTESKALGPSISCNNTHPRWVFGATFKDSSGNIKNSFVANERITFEIELSIPPADPSYEYFILASTDNFIWAWDKRSEKLVTIPFPSIVGGKSTITIKIDSGIPRPYNPYRIKLMRKTIFIWGIGNLEEEICLLGEIEITAATTPGASPTPTPTSVSVKDIEQCITPVPPSPVPAGSSTPAVAAAGKLCKYDFNLGLVNFKSDYFSRGNKPLRCGVATTIGCVPTAPDELIMAILLFLLSIGGGITFLLMLLGAFQMITSAGNPEVLKNGQERFYDAIIGFLFITFSILLLRIIGADILNIPGF